MLSGSARAPDSVKLISAQIYPAMMGIAKVTRNFQVTIPLDIRRIHGIGIGDTVLFAVEGDKVDFKKLEREKEIRAIAGIWKEEVRGSSADYVKGMRSEWEARRKRLGL